MMAYESASGQKLDSAKKDLATKEVVVTGNLAQQVGEDNATNIINQAKLQIIGKNVQNADEIYNIVNNIAVENHVTFSSDEMDAIVSLLQQIAQQSYDIEQMKTTLEEIQESIDKEDEPQTEETPAPEEDGTEEGGNADEGTDEGSDDEEDITQNVDPDVLGDDVKQSSTEDPSLAEETMGDDTDNAGDGSSEEETGIPEATDDGTIPEATEDGSMPEGDGTEQSVDGDSESRKRQTTERSRRQPRTEACRRETEQSSLWTEQESRKRQTMERSLRRQMTEACRRETEQSSL